MKKENNRILALDVIRGIALFGILIVNMMSFHSPYLYINPLKWWTGPWDHLTYIMIDLFFKGSFYPLFSLLFGYSLEIFRERAIEKKLSFNRIAARRFCFLFMIGFVHAFFIWHGDILMVYALIGFFSLPFFKMSPKPLLMFGSVLYVIANMLFTLNLALLEFMNQGHHEHGSKSKLAKAVIHIYQQGNFGEITRQRVHDWLMEYNPQAIILLFFSVFPLFLMGAGLSKLKVMEQVDGYAGKWKRIFVFSIFLGILFKLLPYIFGSIGSLYYLHDLFGGSLQAISYASMAVLLLRKKRIGKIFTAFSFVGKMSLSNYLFQSIFAVFLFYGYGLQLFGKVSLPNGSLLALGIYIFQMIFSAIWLRKFLYGPMEWIWRCFTYLHFLKWMKEK